MKLLIKNKNDSAIEYKLLGVIPLFKKEKFLSCRAYYIFNFLCFKKKMFSDGYELHLLGQRIFKKKTDVIKRIKPHAKGKDFIYFCMHSGDFYYLCSLIKNNFEKFKNTVIITNFKYARLVFELLNFDNNWIDEHFVVVPDLWLWSLCLWCRADGTIISKAQLDHQLGWLVNEKIQKDKDYLTVADTITNFLNEQKFSHVIHPADIKREDIILIIPESQFNGNLDMDTLKVLIESITKKGYKVAINTSSNKYDYLLNDDVSKIFLNYKQTFEFANRCSAIISVRNGLIDCLQNVIKNNVKVFVFYQKWHYPQYKYFKNFDNWFSSVYSFNKINKTVLFMEFKEFNLKSIEQIVHKLEEKNFDKNYRCI